MKRKQKYTNEYVDNSLESESRGIKRVDDVIDNKTKIRFICDAHGHIWTTSPRSIIGPSKSGCPDCYKLERYLSNEKVDKILSDDKREIIRLGEYVNTHTAIRFKCTKEECGYEWIAHPNDVLRTKKTGCPMCAGLVALTNENVDQRLEGRGIKRLDEVNGTHTPIRFMCEEYGHIWSATPHHVTTGEKTGCPECHKINKYRTNEKVDFELIDRGINRIEDYINANTPIEWRCLECSCIWVATPSNILNNKTGCPDCACGRLTNDKIDLRIKNRKLKRKGDCIDCATSIEWECLECNNVWFTTPNHILNQNTGCPECAIGKNEKRIGKYLNDKYGESNVIKQFRFEANNRYYKIDFVVNNIFIEYQGKQHYEPVKYFGGLQTFAKQQKRDFEIKEYCKHNNIKLIEIPYYVKHEEQYNLISNLSDILK